MTKNRSGREAETQPSADQRHDKPTKETGDEMAHGQPPNPEPAEGPRDPQYTRDTVSDSTTDDQKRRAG